MTNRAWADGHISRRGFLRGAAVTAGSAALGAYSAGGTALAKGSSDLAGEISLLNWDVVPGTPLETAINAFEKESGIKVSIQPTPTADYDTKAQTLLAGGTAPDVMRINDNYVRGYSSLNQLTDLRPYLKASKIRPDQYVTPIYDFPKQANGQYTAWCLGTDPRVIFYNVDAFKRAGLDLPPTTWTGTSWTWSDFLDTAKKLTIPGKQYGCLIFDDTGDQQTFTVDNGESQGVFSKDGKKFTLASPKGIKAMQWLADLSNKHHVQPPWSELQPNNGNFDTDLFVNGKVAMIFRTFGSVPYLRKNVSQFTWDIAPVPANVEQKDEGSLIVFAIPKQTPKAKAASAWKLLEYLGGPKGAKLFAQTAYFIPSYKQAEGFMTAGSEPPTHLGLFKAAAANQTTINFTNHDLRARQIYEPQLELAYSGQKSAKDALMGVKAEVEKAMVGQF